MVYRKKRDVDTIGTEIALTDVDGVIYGNRLAYFKPLGYAFRVCITPILLIKLLQWGVKEGFIVSSTPITFYNCNKLKRLKANGK